MRVLTALAVCALAGTAHADIINIGALKDNTLYQSINGDVSNGAGPNIVAGLTNTQELRRAVIAFDIAGSLPAGAVVTGVTLTLHCSNVPVGGGPGPAPTTLHRLLADWGEGTSVSSIGGIGAPATAGDATWTHRFWGGSTWTTPGGDFAATASATQNITGTGFHSWSSAGMIADVQAWLNDPAANFGWAILGHESQAGNARRFDSRENPEPLLRPVLSIQYIPAPGTGVLALAGIGFLARRRR